MSNDVKGIIYASITAVLWGVLAIALKVSLSGLSSADITWFRFVMAFAALAIYYYFKKPQYLRILKRPPILLVLATICLALNYYGFIEGVNYTSPSIAQIFIQLGPVLLAVSGFIFFHEKVNWRQIAGLFLVFSGLIVFFAGQFDNGFTGAGKLQTGVLWVLIAAIMWAVYSVLLKILVLKYPPMQLNLVIFGLPALLYLPFVRFEHFFGMGMVQWLILLFLGLNTLFAYGLLSLAIRCIDANKVSVIIVLNPVLTFLLMALIGLTNAKWIVHEHFTTISILGAVFVLSGGVITIFKKNRQRISAVK
jgi:drug/metabolite transporter (DMT)-like permease